MTKVSIIGAAGTLGAAIAFQLSNQAMISELFMIDINKNLLRNHLMDLQNAFPKQRLYAGNDVDLSGSDIIINAAGTPNSNDVTSRDAFLRDNLALVDELGKQIKRFAPEAIIITASNPVDILNYYLLKKFHFHPRQLIGYTMNDSQRLEWAIRQEVGEVHSGDYLWTPVLGEHGDSQVPIFSHVLCNKQPLLLTNNERDRIEYRLQDWFTAFNKLGINRTTGWTTAVGVSRMVHHLMNPQPSEILGSAVLEGEYGISHVSLGVPISVNKKGILQVREWQITANELERFQASSDKVKSTIESAGVFL